MDYIVQGSIADIQSRFPQESPPLFLLDRIAPEPFGQGNRAFSRNRSLSALERSGDRFAEDVYVVVKQRFELPDVIKILHAAEKGREKTLFGLFKLVSAIVELVGWEDGVWPCGAGSCARISFEAEGLATQWSLDGCGAAVEGG